MSIKDNNKIPNYWDKVRQASRERARIRANQQREWNNLGKNVESSNQVQNTISVDRKRIKDKSIKREELIAKETGGRRHTGSGSLWYSKSDASDSTFQYEDKFTSKLSYRLNLSSLYKVEEEAQLSGKIPVFKVGFPDSKVDVAILRKQDCVVTSDIHNSIFTTGVSVLLKASVMMSYYLSVGGGIILSISFSDKGEYIVMMWKDFLEVKDKIAKGELL